MEELMAFLTKQIVNHPEEVEVNVQDRGEEDLIELNVNGDDLGQVIGRQGRTIRAMRSVARASAARTGRGVQVEIVE